MERVEAAVVDALRKVFPASAIAYDTEWGNGYSFVAAISRGMRLVMIPKPLLGNTVVRIAFVKEEHGVFDLVGRIQKIADNPHDQVKMTYIIGMRADPMSFRTDHAFAPVLCVLHALQAYEAVKDYGVFFDRDRIRYFSPMDRQSVDETPDFLNRLLRFVDAERMPQAGADRQSRLPAVL